MNLANSEPLIDQLTSLADALKRFQQDAVFCADLTFGQFRILDWIVRNPERPMSDLTEFLGVDKSTTTRLIKPLVTREFVVKKSSHQDSRIQLLGCSEQGQAVHQEVSDCLHANVRKLQQALTHNPELLSHLKQITQALTQCC